MIQKLNKKECLQILNNNYIGHLGYIDGRTPVVVPITYFYNKDENNIICYTSEGRKTKAMRENKYVSLCVDEITSVNHWESILVEGTFQELEGPDAKYYLHKFAKEIKKIMAEKEQKNIHFIGEFSSKLESGGIPVVFRINTQEINGKQRKPAKYYNQEKLKSNLV